MVGARGAAWHLELVGDPTAHSSSRPGPEDLLVVYLGLTFDPATVERLVAHGGTRVMSPNPYWERWGATVADPDGYRLSPPAVRSLVQSGKTVINRYQWHSVRVDLVVAEMQAIVRSDVLRY